MNKYIFSIISFILLFSFKTNSLANNNIKEFTIEDTNRCVNTLISDIKYLVKSTKLKRTKYSIALYSLSRDTMLYAHNIEKMLTPASNTKLFTSYAAIRSLGIDYQYSTKVYADTIVSSDSVLYGNIFIVGGGDALFSDEDLDLVAEKISSMGIKKIEGSVYADASFFDSMTDRKVYSGDRDKVQGMPPVTGLSIEKNTATIIVKANGKRGTKVKVQVIPESDALNAKINAKISYKDENNDNESYPYEYIDQTNYGGGSLVMNERRRRASIRIKNSPKKDGTQSFSVNGKLKSKRTYSYRYHLSNPTVAIAGALKSRLENNGISIKGNFAEKKLSELDSGRVAHLLGDFRRNMIDIFYPINKDSDNYYAENLYKLIGANAGNHDDCAVASREEINKHLEKLGIDTTAFKLNDGSGLSRRNLVNTKSIILMLKDLYFSNDFVKFDSTLAVAGIDGTLEKRMLNTSAVTAVHAKTGTLRNVSSLSGYIESLDGEMFAFSMIFNGGYVGQYKDLEDKIAELIASFFYFNKEY